MEPVEEIKEIFDQLKNLVITNQEMGLDPPPISTSVSSYLEGGAADTNTDSDQLDNASLLEELRVHLGDCQRCKLYKGRTNLVFGEGASDARLVFVGEGPGREEDIAGRPFVGEAGGLLTRIIQKGMGLSREEVYICNVVKCRPPRNRDPERDEIDACLPFLKQQLNIIKPDVICILGRVAGQALLRSDFKISLERGNWYSYMDIPVMPTYHPAYVSRNPSRKRQLKGQIWEDIQKIMAKLGLERKNG